MRLSILILGLAAMVVVRSTSGAADAVPKFNIAENCKAEVADASGIGGTLESCIRDEQLARDELVQRWAQFSKEDKTACLRETSIDGTPSYVELQTCLEMSFDANARRGDRK